MKISTELTMTLMAILVIFGYVQSVVVPNVETNTMRAAVSSASPAGIAKASPCNPAITKCGKLVIKKDAVPDSYQDFTFVHQTINGYDPTFILDDDANLPNPSALSNFTAFYTPYNGTFLVAEVVNASYNVSIVCSDPSGGTTVGAAIATISIYQGESVICTFKNVPAAPVACTPNTWTQKANFGGGERAFPTGFGIGTKGYITTGTDANTAITQQDLWEYNPVTNIWTQKASLGSTGRQNSTGFSMGGRGYVGLGSDFTYGSATLQNFLEYNPTTNIWTPKANFGGGPRWNSAGFSINGKGYLGTGMDETSSPFQDFWEYNPATNVWTQKANFGGGPRTSATGFSVGTKGYIGFGIDGNGMYRQDFWEYNPATNVWTQKANIGGGPRWRSEGFSIGNKGYVGIGLKSSLPYPNNAQDFWEYNPTTNIWTQKANFGGGPRHDAAGFSIGNKGYIGVGYHKDINGIYYHDDFWEYCP